MTPHIESNKEDISKLVLMPGDPLRAKYIADNFLTDVKIVNKVRNMYAYTGFYKGEKITNTEYTEIERVTEIQDDKNIYLTNS